MSVFGLYIDDTRSVHGPERVLPVRVPLGGEPTETQPHIHQRGLRLPQTHRQKRGNGCFSACVCFTHINVLKGFRLEYFVSSVDGTTPHCQNRLNKSN